ncbi:MAG TPA: DUF3180 domain-containing protein [Cryptosporangiaceae bacterium]|nr:DUF3180 domain-containing protein [Cryptosporangiaceae bacterium]
MTLPPSPPTPTPRLTPTRPGTLALVALLALLVGWALVKRYYGDLPSLTWFPAMTLVLLAFLETISALSTKARIDRRPDTEPVEPLVVARYAALAKASSLGGAIFGGLYGGVAFYLLTAQHLTAANDDLPEAIGGVVAAAVLVAAALWLEHACRVPKPPEE